MRDKGHITFLYMTPYKRTVIKRLLFVGKNEISVQFCKDNFFEK